MNALRPDFKLAVRSSIFSRAGRPGLRSWQFCLLSGLSVVLFSQLLVAADDNLESTAQASPASDRAPLHQLINRRLSRPTDAAAGLCSDASFLRRVSLDLTGMPPLADEARGFLNDANPDKRAQLIDRLLDSPLFVRHLAASLDVLLMERRTNTHVSQDEWMAWLMQSVRANKPWSVLVKELLLADGDDPANRAPARFVLDRGCEPNLIARDIGRIFFGRDLQCAQCHDSPLVSDFLQSDYQGLLAFTATGYEVKRKPGDKEISVYAERAGSDLSFESVFNKGTSHRTGARLPGMSTLAEPFYRPGEEYTVAPADKVRSVPRFSRRTHLAEMATSGANQAFNENIANRLWSLMFGRGLVHPLDMMHADNPAIDPVLLQELAQHLVESGFDIRSFLRELALSDAYQRPFDLPDRLRLPPSDGVLATHVATLSRRSAELAAASTDAATGYDAATDAFHAAEALYLPASAEFEKARTAYAEALKKRDDANTAMQAAGSSLSTRKDALLALQRAIESAQKASQLVPGDQELAAVVARFLQRTQQLEAEVPALQTAVDEKTKALAAPTEALAAARLAVDSAAAKQQPLRDAVLRAEQTVVAARSKAHATALLVTSTERELEIARHVAGLSEHQQAIAQSDRRIQNDQAAMKETVTALEQQETLVAGLQKRFETAEQTVSMAATEMAGAAAALQQQVDAGEKLASAVASLQAASQFLPGDAAVAADMVLLAERLADVRRRQQTQQDELAVASAAHQATTADLTAVRSEMETVIANRQKLQQERERLQAGLAAMTEELTVRHAARMDACDQVASGLAADFVLSGLKPLTPEQLCWTTFRVTTVYDRYAATEAAELEKSAPLTEEQKRDPAVLRARAADIEQRTYDKLKSYLTTWAQFYGGGAGQPQGDFFASADQALFTANGGSVNSWVVPDGDNAAERIVKAADPRVAAEELFLGILTRMPTDEEVAEVTAILNSRPDRAVAAQELVWGLLNSAEFRFNH